MAILSAMLLLAPSPASAGTYFWTTKDANGKITAQSPACTGGIATGMFYTGPGSPVPTQAYNLTSSNTYGGSGGRISNPSCKGTITATLTWHADPTKLPDPPPPAGSVIVQETCTAGASAQSSPTETCSAQCDDGMGLPGSKQGMSGTPIYNTATPPQIIKYAASVSTTDSRYSVQGGATITLASLSPSSSASAINGPAGWSTNATVSYTISVCPVIVNIIGTNNPFAADYRALTGQQITASFGTPYGYNIPYGTKVTGYTWSLSGGSPIKGWDPNAPGDGQPTQLLPLLPTDYIGTPPIGGTTVAVSPISFYDEIANDTVTVKCAVTLSLPDYSTPTINAASPPVTFLKPMVTRWDVVTGYTQQAFDLRTGPIQTANYGYGLGPVPGLQQQGGEAWNNVTISVPAPFNGGQGCFAQIVTPNFAVTNKDPTKSILFPGNGQAGLDNTFPYRSYTWSVPAPGANIDGPAFIFSGAYNKTADQGFTTVAVHNKFSTWVMYNPPAVGSQGTIWVPLQSYSWEWAFTSVWNGQWPLTTASPKTAADDPHYQPTGVMNIPPQWSMVQNNSQ